MIEVLYIIKIRIDIFINPLFCTQKMATVDYAKYITTLLNNLSLVVWTVANDIADLRSNNQVVIEVLHMLLVIILILYMLRLSLIHI